MIDPSPSRPTDLPDVPDSPGHFDAARESDAHGDPRPDAAGSRADAAPASDAAPDAAPGIADGDPEATDALEPAASAGQPTSMEVAGTFADLGLLPALVRPLERAGYAQPWPVQAQAIPPAMEGRDVIGLAPTGRGKTVAFVAPIADAIVRDTLARSPRGRERRRAPLPAGERLRGLVLCPTRELTMQVAKEAELLLAGTRHVVVAAYGKVSINPQIAAIRQGCDLLVATPGRLRELLDGEALSLVHVSQVAVDEVDRMLDMGFLPQVKWILERLPTARRTSFFTATLPPAAAELARTFLQDPVTVEAGRHTHAAEHVREQLVQCQNHDKVAMLLALFGRGHGRGTLVFCGTRRRVGWVGTALERNGVKVAQLHGDRSQRQRESALAAFIEGEVDVLVCTDVAARGLHLDRVRTVINYDVPNDPEEYVHRVGRAGHGGGEGEAITLVGRRDEEKWEAIAWSVTDPLPYTEIKEFEPTAGPAKAAAARASGGGGGGAGGRGRGRSGSAGTAGGGGGRSGGGRPVRGGGGKARRTGSSTPGADRSTEDGRGAGTGTGTGGRGRRRDAGGTTGSPEQDRTYVTKKQSRPGRNRSRNAARPIPPEEKPGGGVKRPRGRG